mmetsp:Transcript_4312/g.15196  ORF Transcript_4312/g.15196 Transcript_4312/m.15196 type:complete len:259 (+) Transcript_4312:1712-2488(+)
MSSLSGSSFPIIPSSVCQFFFFSPLPSIATSNACSIGARTSQTPSRRWLAPGASRMRANGHWYTGCGANSLSSFSPVSSFVISRIAGAGLTTTRQSDCATVRPRRSSRTTSSVDGQTYRAVQTSARFTSRNIKSAPAIVSSASANATHVALASSTIFFSKFATFFSALALSIAVQMDLRSLPTWYVSPTGLAARSVKRRGTPSATPTSFETSSFSASFFAFVTSAATFRPLSLTRIGSVCLRCAEKTSGAMRSMSCRL